MPGLVPGLRPHAAAALHAENAAVSFELFGDYRSQPAAFQADFLARLAKAGPNVRFHDPYDTAEADRLMQSVHAVAVPSVWWENAPLVIAEALRNRRPVLCSDIGGMAEKVRDGVDGYHFPAGNVMALTALLRRIVADRSALPALASRMVGEPASRAEIGGYLRLYDAVVRP